MSTATDFRIRGWHVLAMMLGFFGFVIAVNVDKERDLADRFLADVPHPFLISFDPSGSVASRYGIEAMPSSVLIDGNGKVITTHAGFFERNRDKYEQRIRAALSL